MSQDFVIQLQDSVQTLGNDFSSRRILCKSKPCQKFFVDNDVDGSASGIIRSFHDNSSKSYFILHWVNSFDDYMEEFGVKYPLIKGDTRDLYQSEEDPSSLGWGNLTYTVPIQIDQTDNPALTLSLYLNSGNRDSHELLSEIRSLTKGNHEVRFTTSALSVRSGGVKHYQPTAEDFIKENMPIWFNKFTFEYK